MEGYKVEILGSSRELTKRERIGYKDTTNALSLIDACADGEIFITVVDYVKLHVSNPYSKKEKEYEKFVLIADTGERYVTGSQSFMETFLDIWGDMQEEECETCEPVTIGVYIKESRNNPQGFLTCRIMF